MPKLLDFYGEFARAAHNCSHCGWSGLGAHMESGEVFSEGVDKQCPQCGQRWGYVQYSVVVADDTLADAMSNLGRVAG